VVAQLEPVAARLLPQVVKAVRLRPQVVGTALLPVAARLPVVAQLEPMAAHLEAAAAALPLEVLPQLRQHAQLI